MPPTKGIIVPGNLEEPGDSRSYIMGIANSVTTAQAPQASPITVLYESFPMFGNRTFWVYFFRCHWETSFSTNSSIDYFGGHPYPTGGALTGTPLWEIAAFNLDTVDNAVDMGRWYKHAFISKNAAGTRTHTFYQDWDNRATIGPIVASAAARGDPTDPALVWFDAPWSQGHEGARTIMGNIRVFEAELTTTQIDNEFTTPGSSGVSYFYANLVLQPDDITDHSGNANHFEWLATSVFTPLQFSDGELGPGAFLKDVRTGISDPHTISFTPAGTPRGIALAAIHGTSSTDHISSVTYGGVSMTRAITAADTVTEPGRADWWFLGSGIPTGTQTVSVDLTSATTDDIVFLVVECTGSRDLEIIDTDSQTADVANPSRSMSKSGRPAFSLGALYGGGSAPTVFVPNADCTAIVDHDFGAFYAKVICETLTDTTDRAIGGTAVSDDVGYVVITVAEVPASSSLAPIRRWDRRIVPLL